MISFLNRKLRAFLFIILVLVAAAFIFIDVPTSGLTGGRHVGEIRGEAVSRSDFQQFYRETEVSFVLTTGQMISQYPGMQDMLLQETWNRLITLKAAQEAGITVSAEEVTDFVTQHPIFQQDGQFNPERFQQFAAAFFDPPGVSIAEGMNLERFESAVRHQLLIEKFNRMIQASAVTSETDISSLINRLHGTSLIKVATVSRADVARNIQIQPDELDSFYQQNLARYMTPEKRKIDYIYFQLASGVPTEGPEREKLMRKLGEQAFQFSDPFYLAYQDQSELPDFTAQAAQAGVTTRQTDFVAVNQAVPGIAGGQKVTQAAFTLTATEPVSDAIEVDDGFVVIHLTEILSSEPISFEQVEPQLREDFRTQEIERRLSIEGRQMAARLRDLMDEGATWEHALKESGFKPGKDLSVTPSLQMRNSEQPESVRLAARSASAMEVKQTSSFELVGDSGYVFYVAERTPPAADIIESTRLTTREQLSAQQGALLVREWVKSQYSAPGTQLPMHSTENF
ncbi:MAG: peptidylprolyl isomerase [Verrucomicrobiota bacterium]